MTEENKTEDVIGDLHAEEANVEEAHDPKNAPAQEVDAADKAGNATGTAKKRKGDKTSKEPMQKVSGAKIDDKGAMPFKEGRLSKAGMINAAYQKMNSMTKEDLANLYTKVMNEDLEDESEAVTNNVSNVKADIDFSADINALVEGEATLSEEFKGKVGAIFEAAINSKLSEEIDRLEAKYEEELASEISETKDGLVDKVDSYLNYVVENWIKENEVAVQSGLRTEIAEKFMGSLKDLFTESYIEVPESKVDLVDELAVSVEELEAQLNDSTAKSISMQEELEGYKREAIIREASKDLAETQIEKLKSLAEKVDFDDEESFATKVSTLKDSYFKKSAVKSELGEIDEDTDAVAEVDATGSMAQYLTALKTQIKN